MTGGSALKAMVSFFTIWSQELTQDDMDAMNSRFHLAPTVGALLGVLVMLEAVALVWLMNEGIFGSSLFTAVALLATVYAMSRFLHFDGLADFGDGSIVAGTREDHIRALKDTLIGAGGVGVALIVTLLNVSLYAMAASALIAMAPLTEVLVKNAQVATAAFGIPGNGMAGRQVGETRFGSLCKSTAISIVLVIALSFLCIAICDLVFGIGFQLNDVAKMSIIGGAGIIASAVIGYLMAHRANKVFGMVNGDILGATNEISRTVIMAVMILALNLV